MFPDYKQDTHHTSILMRLLAHDFGVRQTPERHVFAKTSHQYATCSFTWSTYSWTLMVGGVCQWLMGPCASCQGFSNLFMWKTLLWVIKYESEQSIFFYYILCLEGWLNFRFLINDVLIRIYQKAEKKYDKYSLSDVISCKHLSNRKLKSVNGQILIRELLLQFLLPPAGGAETSGEKNQKTSQLPWANRRARGRAAQPRRAFNDGFHRWEP